MGRGFVGVVVRDKNGGEMLVLLDERNGSCSRQCKIPSMSEPGHCRRRSPSESSRWRDAVLRPNPVSHAGISCTEPTAATTTWIRPNHEFARRGLPAGIGRPRPRPRNPEHDHSQRRADRGVPVRPVPGDTRSDRWSPNRAASAAGGCAVLVAGRDSPPHVSAPSLRAT